MADIPDAPLSRRDDFVLFFDVRDGNPNGDPDAGNMPRADPETGEGLVTDVSLKRKVRNYVSLARAGRPGFEIYMRAGAILNVEHRRAYAATLKEEFSAEAMRKGPKAVDQARGLTRWMCDNFYDIRTFGAVMTTGVNAGQVRGPVQMSFGRSIDPIAPLEITMTRLAATTEADAEAKGGRTMGRKYIVPYGLYRVHGHVNAMLASDAVKGTGFSQADLDLFYEALWRMFDFDKSSQRGEMASRRLIVFRHASALGSAGSHELFDRVRVRPAKARPGAGEGGVARHFTDYAITIDRAAMPRGVTILENAAVFADPATGC